MYFCLLYSYRSKSGIVEVLIPVVVRGHNRNSRICVQVMVLLITLNFLEEQFDPVNVNSLERKREKLHGAILIARHCIYNFFIQSDLCY
jgi:hypothetical protein